MIETNGHAPDLPATAEVLRLTDAQRAYLAPYVAAWVQAQQNLNAVFSAVLVGRGVDLDTHEARLSPDGGAALVTVRAGAGVGEDEG